MHNTEQHSSESTQRVGHLSYGSDTNGLVCAYSFDANGQAHAIDSDQIDEYVRRHQAPNSQGFIWLHFDLGHSSTDAWMRHHLQLSDEFYESLHQGETSTYIEQADHQLIAVMNDVLYDFAFEPSEIATLWAVVDRSIMVTGRYKRLSSINQLRRLVTQGMRFESTSELLSHLLEAQSAILVNITRQVSARVDKIEDQVLLQHTASHRRQLGQLRRVLVRLARLLAPEPAALFRLLQHPPYWLTQPLIDELRAAFEEFHLTLVDLSALQERIKLLQEEITAQAAEANNRSIFILTIVTVLALPINITAGLMGMNVGGVPLAQNPHGFWWVSGSVLLLTATVAYWIFKRMGD